MRATLRTLPPHAAVGSAEMLQLMLLQASQKLKDLTEAARPLSVVGIWKIGHRRCNPCCSRQGSDGQAPTSGQGQPTAAEARYVRWQAPISQSFQYLIHKQHAQAVAATKSY